MCVCNTSSICFHFHSEYNIMFRHQFPVLCMNGPHSLCKGSTNWWLQSMTWWSLNVCPHHLTCTPLYSQRRRRCSIVMDWYSGIPISLLLCHLYWKVACVSIIIWSSYCLWTTCNGISLDSFGKCFSKCQAWFQTVDHWSGDFIVYTL